MSRQVQDAYIVAATRTPVGKAPRGMFKTVRPDDMLAHVLKSVVNQCPGIDTGVIDDVIVGCAMPEAEQGMNVARIGLLLAGFPNTVSGMTINRFCSSGVQAVALAADRIQISESYANDNCIRGAWRSLGPARGEAARRSKVASLGG